ncbi:MAG: hypothetical protein WCO48_00370 [Candidatus Taylorbacteria bacterium]
MDTNNQTTQPTEHRKIGPIVVTLVVVLVLVIVALYMFASRISQQGAPDMTKSDTSTAPVVQQPQTVPTVTNTADDVQSLKDDLNASVSGLDSQNF